MENGFLELDLPVAHVEHLIKIFDVQVESADGWFPVTDFVHKGHWDEYVLETEDGINRVRVSGGHLFETETGWQSADDLESLSPHAFKVLTTTGYKNARVFKTGNSIPIVDITVDHENHRYFTEGVSSHNTGGGKSLMMCHVAASTLMQGKNVLYISMEMSEERIAERIDANLFNTEIQNLRYLPESTFKSRVDGIKNKTQGRLIVKEYPTGAAHAGHFRALIEELKQKKNFIPDLIIVDYINICASQRIRANANANSYTLIKSIAEELRAIAQEYKVPMLTATQLNRCLDPSTEVISKTHGKMEIKDVEIGDFLYSNNGWNKVQDKFSSVQKMYKVTTKSGKRIICSSNHLFPVYDDKNEETLVTINGGLSVGSKIKIL